VAGTPVAAEAPQLPADMPFPFGDEPADQITVAEIEAAIRALVACGNAGDFPRLYALLSDAYLINDILGLEPLEEDAWQFLDWPPEPLLWDQQTEILSIDDVRVLDDGRVAATVTLNRAGTQSEPSVTIAIFLKVGDRWLLDGESAPVTDPTPETS